MVESHEKLVCFGVLRGYCSAPKKVVSRGNCRFILFFTDKNKVDKNEIHRECNFIYEIRVTLDIIFVECVMFPRISS